MKNFIKFTLFMILLVCLLKFLSILYGSTRDDAKKLHQFYREPRDSIDVIILGASTTRCAIIPAVMWDETGISSYNFSTEKATSAIQYYWLKESIKRQSPSVAVIFATYYLVLPDDYNITEAHIRDVLDPMRMSINKMESVIDIVSDSENQTAISYIFPIFRYHGRETIPWENIEFYFSNERSYSRGYTQNEIFLTFSSQERPLEYGDVNFKQEYEVNCEYLSRMIDVCKKNGIKVLLIDIAKGERRNYSVQIKEEIQHYADDMGVDYIDFRDIELIEGIKLDYSTDFYNIDHVNISGGTKISRYLANYLFDKYDLPDKRTEGYDIYWNRVFDYYCMQYSVYQENLELGQ